MKGRIKVRSQSQRAVKIKVARIYKELDEKPQPLPDLSEDTYDQIREDLLDYDAIKNGEQENPFLDDRSV